MSFKALKRWIPLIVLVTLMIVTFSSGLQKFLSLETLQENKEVLLSSVNEYPILSSIIFVSLYIVFVALSLPAATLLTLMGGFLFGSWLGTFFVVTAATIGATIIFMVARTSLGTTLREKAGGLYMRIEKNMKENAIGYLLFMRLVPAFPFFLVNIVPALFNVPLRTYIATTFFGIIPGSFVYVNLGKQVATITNLGDLISTETLLAFALLGVFSLIPTVIKQVKTYKKEILGILVIAPMFLISSTVNAGMSETDFNNVYDGLLKTHIIPTAKNGITYNGVNYDNWATDDRHKRALDLLLISNPDSYDDPAKKAFWINTYNFLTIDLIIREGERQTIKNLGNLFSSPWKKYSWSINGKHYTLDQIENEILRPMGDPRIHFAINCASKSCPDLRTEVYRANQLEKQLNEQVSLTLRNAGKGFRRDGDTVYVSKILDWFSDDFKNGNVKSWLMDYVDFALPFTLQFMDYDWSLNDQ